MIMKKSIVLETLKEILEENGQSLIELMILLLVVSIINNIDNNHL